MRKVRRSYSSTARLFRLLLAGSVLSASATHAQSGSIRDYVLYGNNSVTIGTSTNILSGNVGSGSLVQTTGNSNIAGAIYSGGRVVLSNSNSVGGTLTAANRGALSGIIFQAGSNASLTGNVFVNGDGTVSGGTLSGVLYMPSGSSYTGPFPVGGRAPLTQQLPAPPTLPIIQTMPSAGNTPVNGTQAVYPLPVKYGALQLNGSKTVTFTGTGTYVFSRIRNTGNTNKFILDFGGDTEGVMRIYVHGDVDLYKLSVEIINGGSPSRVFMEVHGTGSTNTGGNYAWIMANGASGPGQSLWLGTVWAPNGGIFVGSGSTPSKVIGSLWSGRQVFLDNGANIEHAPFAGCPSPQVNAGPDRSIDCDNPSTTLQGSSTTPGVSYSWSVIGGNFSSTSPTPTVTAGGSYVLTVTDPGCGGISRDTVVVTKTPCILPYYPPSPVGKVRTKIGSELTSLLQNFGNVSDSARAIFLLRTDSVLIDVIAYEGQVNNLKSILLSNTYGIRDTISNGANSLIITGWFPIAKLHLLNGLGQVNYVRPAFPAINNNGVAKSQGDSAMRTNLVRNGYGLSGDSIKVGVLSDSYNTLAGDPASIDVNNGDLPGTGNPVYPTPVQVLKEFPLGRRSDEGRAMLQIIHDVAPKAQLAFRTGFLTPGDFAEGIRELADSGCQVLVDDITFITEPFFRPGVISNSIRQVSDRGVSYVTAAGNFGNKAYGNLFNRSSVALPSGLSGRAHDFGGGDIFQNDSLKPGVYTIVLQWEDDIYSLGGSSGTANDLDIYLTDDNGVTLFGFNRDNTGGDPIEVLPFTVTQPTATNILIVNASDTLANGPVNLRFKYVVFRGDLKINEYISGSSTIVGQASSDRAITVGAALYANTPAFGLTTPTPASFSSLGGTPVNNVVGQKPDLVGPNGVNTTVNFGSLDYEGDGRPNFFGTSAAAPHVAATVALLMEARKKFYDTVLTPAQARSLLVSNAIDMDASGFDFKTGFGFIQADSAMRSIANPRPQVIRLELGDSTLTPGAQPMELIIHGSYFTNQSVVVFGSDTLTTTIVNNTTATTTLPTFNEERLIQVYTDPQTPSGLDGGLSNSISITGVPKKNIQVIAHDKTKKFGEQMPAYSFTVLVDGDSLSRTTLSLADLGLGSVSFTTPATPMSNVGLYFIRPVRVFNPANAADALLLGKYNYSFTDGLLTVQKLPITVKARDTSIVYGEPVGDIRFSYSKDPSVVLGDSAALFNLVTTNHNSLLANNVLGLVNGQAVTIVNGQAIPIVNGQAVTIVNGQAVTIVNGQAIPIVNAQAITIVNGQAVTIVNSLTASQVENLTFMVSEQSVQNARTLSNNTRVVDITQESILDFFSNPTQTELLQSVSAVNQRGLVSASALINGQAVTIVNGQAITIVNGQAVTIVNGQAVTIVNGQAITIVNSLNSTTNKTGVVIDQNDMGPGGAANLRSLNMVTGLGVGQQFIIPGALLNDNFEVRYVPGQLNILAAPLTLRAKDTSKIYGQALSFDSTRYMITAGSLRLGDAIEKIGMQSAGTAASASGGTYPILASAAVGSPGTDLSNYNITYQDGTLTVNKVQLTVRAKDTAKLYGSANPVFEAQYSGFINGQNLASSGITGSPSLTSTATAASPVGSYPITAAQGSLSSANYSFSFQNGVLTVNRTPLTVKADDKVMFQGDQLPQLTGTLTGLKNNDLASYSYSVTGYTGSAGVYPIVPAQVNFPNAGSYTITLLNGTLYVNPKGPGAKKLRPYLDCVEEVNPTSTTRRYIAHFFCENPNPTPVYVPVGPDNRLTGTSYDGTNQPVLFQPGLTRFDVPFDGNALTWELRTYESNKKSAVGSNASANSNRCSYTTRTQQAAGTEERSAQQPEWTAAPNPVQDEVRIRFNEGQLNVRTMRLQASDGRTQPIRSYRQVSDREVIVNLSGNSAGMYFLQIEVDGRYRTVRVVKL